MWVHDTLFSWWALSQLTKASQAMSMAESEGLGVQLLWTSLTSRRHCSAFGFSHSDGSDLHYSLGRMVMTRPKLPGAGSVLCQRVHSQLPRRKTTLLGECHKDRSRRRREGRSFLERAL